MKRLTVKDVAKEAGVSTATISRVLNGTGYVGEETREQVLEAIRKLQYQPNSIARSLKQEKTRSVGIVLPDMTNPYFMTLAGQIQRMCMEAGYHLLYMDSGDEAAQELAALQFLMEQRVQAVVLAGTGRNQERVEVMQSSGIHVVLIDRRLEGIVADAVTEDNRSAAEEAVRYLLTQGHRKVGIIGGPQSIVTARERHEGVEAAYRRAGLELDPTYVCEGDYTRRSGKAAIHRLMGLGERPTAVFSANNEMTYGLYLGLSELGLPTDSIEVVSFGDLEFSPLFPQRLTVMMQNPVELGEAAGAIVLNRLDRSGGSVENRMYYPRMVHKF